MERMRSSWLMPGLVRTAALAAFLLSGSAPAGESPPRSANRLLHQTSPYLLQHAHNPVDWFPWGEKALEKARREGKLLFISIGYAACHWCHVMERESFADEKTAARLNARFVAIKVDREERPDIDAYFMAVVQAMTGSGGWPLTVIATPDLKPVFGGVYLPPEPRHGRPSLTQVLTLTDQAWTERREEVKSTGARLERALQSRLEALQAAAPQAAAGEDPRPRLKRLWLERYDDRHGGFGNQPKFPQSTVLSFLLRRGAAGSRQALEAALHTLDAMAAGGVRDQAGGTFHRYAVDRRWRLPHFEIMLYDNALLANAYLEAYLLAGQERRARTVREILDDLLDRFRLDGGCFASSLDADSGGMEGGYYTWTEEEVIAVLGEARGRVFIEAFLDPFEDAGAGRAVLRHQGSVAEAEAARTAFGPELRRLAEARRSRPAPARDDKALTSWNGLMITALARAGAALDEPRFLAAARSCADALSREVEAGGRLSHSRRAGRASPDSFLDDYAFLLQGVIDLFEASGDAALLRRAEVLADSMLRLFLQEAGGPLQLTPVARKSRLPPRTELEDGATPSGNAVAASSLRRLTMLTGLDRFEEAAADILQGAGPFLSRRSAMTGMARAWDLASPEGQEAVIVSRAGDPVAAAMLSRLRRQPRPGMTLAWVDADQPEAYARWPALAGRVMVDGQASAYLCRNFVCERPVTDDGALEAALRR